MEHIGIVDVTTAGAAMCANAVVRHSADYFAPGVHPEFTLHSLSFHRYRDAVRGGDWDAMVALVVESVTKLHATGADFVIIPSNTPHYAIEGAQLASPLPILSLLEVVSEEARAREYRRVLVLGTVATMRGGLYTGPLKERGMEAVFPDQEAQGRIDRLIRLDPAEVTSGSPALQSVLSDCRSRGCDAAILGSTELSWLVHEGALGIPVLDTMDLLARAAVRRCAAAVVWD